jgi:ketosteroid isomerase-like protein
MENGTHMSDQASLEVVLSVYEAFRHGNIGAVLNHIDPHGDLNFRGTFDDSVGWTVARTGRVGKVLRSHRQQPRRHHADHGTVRRTGEKVVAVGRYQGRVKLTGKQIDSPVVHLWTVRNGLVIRCQELTNTALEAAMCTAGGETPQA